jgi:hypothetical protein
MNGSLSILAIVLGSETVRNMLVNYAKGFIFTAGPAFPFAACMRAAVNLLRNGQAEPVSLDPPPLQAGILITLGYPDETKAPV